jgi:hypothetical protein
LQVLQSSKTSNPTKVRSISNTAKCNTHWLSECAIPSFRARRDQAPGEVGIIGDFMRV